MVKGTRFTLPATLSIIQTFKEQTYVDDVQLEPINAKDYWLVVDGEKLFEGRKVDLMHALMLSIYVHSKVAYDGLIEKFNLDKYGETMSTKEEK